MSKIAMFTMGTRGDVQPYIYLSKQLIRSGHFVTLGTHPCWKSLVESAGVHFEPVGPDIDIEKEAAIIRGKNSNPAFSMLKTMNFVFKIIQNSTTEIYEICKNQDLIIVTHSQMGAVEADILGIPTVNVTLQKEMIGEKLKPKSFKDILVGGMIAKQVAKPYNKIRKSYGLKPLKTIDNIMSKDLNLIPISKYVLKRNKYWEDKNILTGYWYYDEPEYIPDKNLVEFINAGEPPIILALGAMSFEEKSEKDKLDMFVNAFKKTGCRAIIQGFQKTLETYELPDTMMACGSVPHSYLFTHSKFVIHHCGFGTSAASMIYGIPSIPVPHVLDQIGFANQLYEVNVAIKPIKSKDLSEDKIIAAIEEMNLNYEEKKDKAIAISNLIQEENGVLYAVNLIEDVLKKYNL